MSINRTAYERISISRNGSNYSRIAEKTMEYLSSFDNAIMLKELGLWFIRLNVDSEYAEITDIHVETGNYYSVIIGETNQMIIFPVSNDLSLFASAKDFDALVRKIPASDNVTIELSYYMNNFINGSFASYYWKMVIDQFNEDISDVFTYSSLEEGNEDDTIMFEYTTQNKGKPLPTKKSNFDKSALWRAELMYFYLNISSRIKNRNEYINKVSDILKEYSDNHPKMSIHFDVTSADDGIELYFNKEGETYSEKDVRELSEVFAKAARYIETINDFSEDDFDYNYYIGLKPANFNSANAIIVANADEKNEPLIQYYSY